ncbi:TetR/AcrR family transcriptional regulator [Leptospira selangorensis]|uniref:TetR/AcrR family transcriptional regulator n=1 Tax=Leptospira selangorensis TaxID=2484982 RepID=A0A4R9GGB0_9LEPT|nr:TetR/AcrR family transcriptional regulator [Leptospira selangorensis]TGK10452.1 TetR/AcrR family transcriptional regulator [Leptospira selangorensis]TGM13309.1 TetR/AcrR family transcriptional regulator [Leptospira selangorensis]TGM22349.1 TetR/AcrR family transcriptional regulator [Leptospira selangorensis]
MVRTPKKKVKKSKVSKAGAHGSNKGPKKRDRKATETALMKAGIQVFAKKGYDAATTKDIAKTAGANEALIMRYFGGKKGLLEAILTRTDDLGDSATGKKEEETKQLHLDEALVESITERCSDFKHYSDFMKVAVSRIILDPDVSRIIQTKIYTKALPEMIHELEKFKKGGEIDPKADLKSVAFGISSLTFALGFMAQVVYKIPESEIKATIKEMVRILQKGLKPDSK